MIDLFNLFGLNIYLCFGRFFGQIVVLV